VTLPGETASPDVRAEVAELRARLANVEALLRGLYGPAALGGPSPVQEAPPPVTPQPTVQPLIRTAAAGFGV
jgi:hypothetical protein